VSKAATLAKLQSLLERVRSRSNMPRNGQAGPAEAAAAAIDVEPPALLSLPSSLQTPAPVLREEEHDDSMDVATLPPPAALEAAAEPEITVDVDIPEPPPISHDDSITVSIEEGAPPAMAMATPEESVSPAASESAERLVAADRTASEPQVEVMFASVPPPTAVPPAPEKVAAVEAAPAEGDASMELDADGASIAKAPASSRRPVAPGPEEQIAEVAFGSEEPQQPPRHTPPPESGRLPASPVEEFDADVTGVRTAPQQEKAVPVEEPELEPIATRAQLPSGESIIDVTGAPSAFVPATFASWLDATLSL
jgi:hypothetical protein